MQMTQSSQARQKKNLKIRLIGDRAANLILKVLVGLDLVVKAEEVRTGEEVVVVASLRECLVGNEEGVVLAKDLEEAEVEEDAD